MSDVLHRATQKPGKSLVYRVYLGGEETKLLPDSASYGPVVFLNNHEWLYLEINNGCPLLISKYSVMRLTILPLGAFTYDVRCFWVIFDLPTYPNQIS